MAYFAGYNCAPRHFSSWSASATPLQLGGLSGSRISVSTLPGLSSMRRPDYQQNSAAPRPDDKETMKGLNDRLADYLNRVRDLEQSNGHLEEQIKELLKKRRAGTERDWSVYEKPLSELRKQVRDMTMDNARLVLQIDNARLASEDFKVKYESELALRQSVEHDLMGLRKIIDDTNVARMQLEGQIESLTEELAFLKKNHQEEVAQLRSQIADSSVTVEMDTPKAPDLNETIASIRTQYEKAVQKNLEDTEAWYKNKFDDWTTEMTHNTEALQAGKSEINDLRRQKQTLEIELQTMHNMNRSLEDTLNEVEARNAKEMAALNQRLLQLEAELTRVREQIERQAAEYQALLNTKTKLEAEIHQYHSLLEGGTGDSEKVELHLEDALQFAPQCVEDK